MPRFKYGNRYSEPQANDPSGNTHRILSSQPAVQDKGNVPWDSMYPSTSGGSFIWMYGLGQRIGMRGGKVFFAGLGGGFVETSHFR